MGSTSTCSVRIGHPSLDMSVNPGGTSSIVMQSISNTGTLGLKGVEIDATRWRHSPSGDLLPSSLTELSVVDPSGTPDTFEALSPDGTAPAAPLAVGLEPGGEISLWLRINMDGRPEQSGTLAQDVAYVAECMAPSLQPSR